MDVSEAAAGLVQAALNIAAPQVMLPGDVNEVPEHLSRVKLGKNMGLDATHSYILWENYALPYLFLSLVLVLPLPPSPPLFSGNGLISAPSPPGAAKATKAGILRFQPPNTYRIDNQQRRVSKEVAHIIANRKGIQADTHLSLLLHPSSFLVRPQGRRHRAGHCRRPRGRALPCQHFRKVSEKEMRGKKDCSVEKFFLA